MHPSKVDRKRLNQLTDLPNIGKACAEDLRLLGIFEPVQLIGKNPYELFEDLCDRTGVRIDPCMLDTFISITRFMDGEAPQPWWAYTRERKESLQKLSESKDASNIEVENVNRQPRD